MVEPTSTKPDVTVVAKDIGPIGGMERQLTELVSGLLSIDHRVTVISSTCALPAHPRLRWVRVPAPSRPFAIAYPWFVLLASLLVWIRGRGVIHSTGAMILNRASVCTVHYCHHAASRIKGFTRVSRPGLAYEINARIANRLSIWGERWCYRPRRVGVLVGVSQGVARELNHHFPEMRGRILVIPNGVDTDLFFPGPASSRPDGAEGLEGLFVGSEWERKGLRTAIEALTDSPAVKLTVVGTGDTANYRALAAELGVAERVDFVGATDDVASWYRRADVFVLPTAYETFSLVSYEAAASGLPLLVTQVNGVEDLLRDGVNGWFIQRDAASLAGYLRRLQSDHQLRVAMGRQAREDSLRFSWSRVVNDYSRLYARSAEREFASSHRRSRSSHLGLGRSPRP